MRHLALIPTFVLALSACSDVPVPSAPESIVGLASPPIAALGSPVLLYATGKIPSRIVSVVDVTDLDAMTLLDWRISLDTYGHDAFGVDVDASGNVILAGGFSQEPWLGVVDGTLAIVGETNIADAVPGAPLDVTFRSSDQAVVCSSVAPGNPSRLLVFDVSDLANPVQTGASDIPGTGGVDGCRAIAFDEQGDLWVITGGDGNLVRMTLDPAGVPTSTQVTLMNFPWGAVEMAIEPGTNRIFLSLVNSGHIGVVDPADPSRSAALITDVCESALGSPQGLEFSSAGNLFVGCSNLLGATDDLKAIPASSLVGLVGEVSAATLDVRGADLGPPGVTGPDGTMGFLAIRPGPVPPGDQVDAMSSAVADLVTSGALDEGNGNALQATLANAAKALANDRPNVPNLLNAFINQVEGFINGGTLSPADGQILIDAAQSLIDQLEG